MYSPRLERNCVLWLLFLFQVNKGVTRVDLADFASQLDAQADQLVRYLFLVQIKCNNFWYYMKFTLMVSTNVNN